MNPEKKRSEKERERLGIEKIDLDFKPEDYGDSDGGRDEDEGSDDSLGEGEEIVSQTAYSLFQLIKFLFE